MNVKSEKNTIGFSRVLARIMLASGSQECLRPADSHADLLASGVINGQGSRSRLVIHQIVMENFKSYEGRQVIGPFHKVLFTV